MGKQQLLKLMLQVKKSSVAVLKTIIDADGELAYLVNNAGITKDKLALRMSVVDFNDVIRCKLNIWIYWVVKKH